MKKTIIFITVLLLGTEFSATALASCDKAGKSVRFGVHDEWTYKERVALGAADFGSICDKHQACYETKGRLKSRCDREFHQALKKECSIFRNTRHVYEACLKTADNGLKFVQSKAGSFYRAAQRKQQRAERDGRREDRFQERQRRRMDARRQ